MKDQLLVLMEALVQQRTNLVLTSVLKGQNFGLVCIIVIIINICLLTKQKYLS